MNVKTAQNAKKLQKGINEMEIERNYKADIIIMGEKENGEYQFYLIDSFNEQRGSQEVIEYLAEKNNAKISWFPTSDPNIAKMRKLLKKTGAEKDLLAQAREILEGVKDEYNKNRPD